MGEFERLMPRSELSSGQTRVVAHKGQMVMLVQLTDGGVRAYDARCPHANTVIPAMALGPDMLIECPMHGAIFDAGDGSRIDGPTCGDLVAWPVRVVDSYIEAEVPERIVSNEWRPASWGAVGRASTAGGE